MLFYLSCCITSGITKKEIMKSGSEGLVHNEEGLSKNLLVNRARLLFSDSQAELAKTICINILQKEPGYLPAISLLGDFLFYAKDYVECLACYEQVLLQTPAAGAVRYNAALAYRRLGNFEQALEYLGQVCQQFRWLGIASHYMAEIFFHQKSIPAAKQHFNLALQKHPYLHVSYEKLGDIAFEESHTEEAIAYYQQALHLLPTHEALYSKLHACYQRKKDRKASKELEKFRHEEDTFACEKRYSESIRLFTEGDLVNGWRALEAGRYLRKGRGCLLHRMVYPFKLWEGEPLQDKVILILPEQGLGDELIYATCFPDIIRLAKECIICCDRRLGSLYQRAFPNATIIAGDREDFSWLTSDKKIDFQISMQSLPLFFRRNSEDFPTNIPLLYSDNALRKNYGEKYFSSHQRLRVGIIWSSHWKTKDREAYFSSLEDYESFFEDANIELYSLQLGDAEAALKAVEVDYKIRIHRSEDLDLFNDLEAIVAYTTHLDWVIGPSTATLFLAAAAGVKTVLYFNEQGHREMVGTDRYPWFPTIKVFLKESQQDWKKLLNKIHQFIQSETALKTL